MIEVLRAALAEVADPARAPGMQAYMKSTMPFLGVRVPAVRALVRRLAKGETDAALLQESALTLWREAHVREERYAALALMALPALRGDAATLPVHEEMIRTGFFSMDAPDRFTPIVDALTTYGDHFMLVADYPSYIACQDAVDALYLNEEEWSRRAILNVAGMGRFSSDRTIQEYASNVWGVTSVTRS